MIHTTTLAPSEPARPPVCAEIVRARYCPFVISSVCPAMSTLSLHFEYIHSFHPNHCRHPIHHILYSHSSYNLALVFTFFPLEPSFFAEISSLVTPFKSAWPLSSVVVSFLGLFLFFINLDFFPDGSRPIGFRSDPYSVESESVDRFRLSWPPSGPVSIYRFWFRLAFFSSFSPASTGPTSG